MKVYEDRIRAAIPERTERVCVGRTCDLCGLKAMHGEDWDAGSYVVNETELTVAVKHKEGYSVPEGGSGTEIEVDLCPKCFRDRLVPWLRSQGAVVEVQDWDW